MSLRDLPIKLSYRSKDEDNIIEAFLVPALKNSTRYKRSVGFFSSSVFELIEAGIENFINNEGMIQIICSPELSKEDIDSIKLGYRLRKSVVDEKFIGDVEDILEDIDTRNLSLLTQLIRDNQLNIIVADMNVIDSFGIYHDKIGILEDKNGNKVLFVGSANESKNAYKYNYEKIRISVSWNESDALRIEDDEIEFDEIWKGKNKYINSYDCTEIVAQKIEGILRVRNSEWEYAGKTGPIVLRGYQEDAINAWVKNGERGFFVMATGTGKTWTAIYAALHITRNENILLVICAPYKHLVKQWYKDVHAVLPESKMVLVSSENQNWENELVDAILNTKYNGSGTVIAISTILSFNTKRFERAVSKTNMNKMLIVDEAHRFKNLDINLSNSYQYMLGLSATPSNKRNDERGKELMDFFGGQVYNLPIEVAINQKHLVHYEYHPIFVKATYEEEKEFERYTNLMISCFKNNVCIDIDGLVRYKRDRLRVISMAKEKNEKIQWILGHIKEKDHFIIYCGDGRLFSDNEIKGIKHIQYVKAILTELGFKVSQFTAQENIKERMQLVDAFNKGMIDSMVAIRCLDEGINIPSIKGALLLSSNDDYREFVQRRGRILRTYRNRYTGEAKESANIYDVIVLPRMSMKSFVTIELRRFYEYARLADNRSDCMSELDDLLIQYKIDIEDIKNVEEDEDDLDE